MADHDFNALVKKAVAAFNAMSPEEQAAHREAQRQSWVRGEIGMRESAVRVKATIDPTDRQHAEAKVKQVLKETDFNIYWSAIGGIADALLEAEQRARSEGWEAGREAAAKVCDRRSRMGPNNKAVASVLAAAIRSLKPKEP